MMLALMILLSLSWGITMAWVENAALSLIASIGGGFLIGLAFSRFSLV